MTTFKSEVLMNLCSILYTDPFRLIRDLLYRLLQLFLKMFDCIILICSFQFNLSSIITPKMCVIHSVNTNSIDTYYTCIYSYINVNFLSYKYHIFIGRQYNLCSIVVMDCRSLRRVGMTMRTVDRRTISNRCMS